MNEVLLLARCARVFYSLELFITYIMNRIKTYLNSFGRTSRTIVIGLAVIFVSAGIAQAATTITTDISTGALTLTGALSGTSATFSSTITQKSGDTIKNASASSTAISGSLIIGDSSATRSTLVVTNGTTATSTLTVGCINSTATSTLTPIHLIFGVIGTTTVSGTSNGSVEWAYGACP